MRTSRRAPGPRLRRRRARYQRRCPEPGLLQEREDSVCRRCHSLGSILPGRAGIELAVCLGGLRPEMLSVGDDEVTAKPQRNSHAADERIVSGNGRSAHVHTLREQPPTFCSIASGALLSGGSKSSVGRMSVWLMPGIAGVGCCTSLLYTICLLDGIYLVA